jgi:cell pole-organizing protein PopZ
MSSQAASPQSQTQTEPTMEEILASIRKIISEDQPGDGAKLAVRPTPLKAQPSAVTALAAAPAADLDVLDLTDEIPDDPPIEAMTASAPMPVLVPTPALAIENDVIFQAIEPDPLSKEPPMDNDLISDTTRHAMGRALANLNGRSGPDVAPKNGSVESIFADAVQQAFRPVLKEWVDEHSEDVMEQLRPLIRAWMDEHLPPLIEAAVMKEILRAADRARKP